MTTISFRIVFFSLEPVSASTHKPAIKLSIIVDLQPLASVIVVGSHSANLRFCTLSSLVLVFDIVMIVAGVADVDDEGLSLFVCIITPAEPPPR
jgi:hypothetical protein